MRAWCPPSVDSQRQGYPPRCHPPPKNAATGLAAPRFSGPTPKIGGFGPIPARSGQEPDIDPGVTRHPTRGGHWLQGAGPGALLGAVQCGRGCHHAAAVGARRQRRNLAVEGWETLRELEVAGELRIDGRRILPPARTSPLKDRNITAEPRPPG